METVGSWWSCWSRYKTFTILLLVFSILFKVFCMIIGIEYKRLLGAQAMDVRYVKIPVSVYRKKYPGNTGIFAL